ncbi:MAG: hypothetical protein WBB45_20955 [Cyclobacteriaceae bacterium]
MLISNNPLELSKVYEVIQQVKDRKISLVTSFSMSESVEKAALLRPDCIIIDDTFEKAQIEDMVRRVTSRKRTSHASFALLKSSNYGLVAANGIQEFLLKDDLSPEKLVRTILSAMRLRQSQSFLVRTYRVNKRMMKRIIRGRRTRVGQAIENIAQALQLKQPVEA